MIYECHGADQASQDILNGLGASATPPVPPPNFLDLNVTLATDAITSPAQGAPFSLPLRWTVTLPESVTVPASRLGITSIAVSNVRLTAGVSAGSVRARLGRAAAGHDPHPRCHDRVQCWTVQRDVHSHRRSRHPDRRRCQGRPSDGDGQPRQPARDRAHLRPTGDGEHRCRSSTSPVRRRRRRLRRRRRPAAGGPPTPAPAAAEAAPTALATTGGVAWGQLALAIALLDLGYLAVERDLDAASTSRCAQPTLTLSPR